jgi:hypothetical protein
MNITLEAPISSDDNPSHLHSALKAAKPGIGLIGLAGVISKYIHCTKKIRKKYALISS